MNDEHDNFWGEPISVYTRAQAIADGVLVDVSDTAREAGWRVPVALTRALWEDCVEWTADDSRKHGTCQDVAGRLWDVVWMSRLAAHRHAKRCEQDPTLDPSTCQVQLYRVPREGRGHMPRLTRIKLMISGGDEGEPVATIMLTNED